MADEKAEARRLASLLLGSSLPVVIHRWGFLRFLDPSRPGVCIAGSEDGYERLSSAVLGIDTESLTARTASGRRYVLAGEPDPDYALQVPHAFGRLSGMKCELVSLEDAASEAAHWRRLLEGASG